MCFSDGRTGFTVILHDRLLQIPKLVVKGYLLHSGCSQTLLHSGEGTKCTTMFGAKTIASSKDERKQREIV